MVKKPGEVPQILKTKKDGKFRPRWIDFFSYNWINLAIPDSNRNQLQENHWKREIGLGISCDFYILVCLDFLFVTGSDQKETMKFWAHLLV